MYLDYMYDIQKICEVKDILKTLQTKRTLKDSAAASASALFVFVEKSVPASTYVLFTRIMSLSDFDRLITCEFDSLILPSISHSSDTVSLLRQKINGRINSYQTEEEVCLERTSAGLSFPSM